MDSAVKSESNSLAVASLVFGILGIAGSWTVVAAIPNALLAIMFAELSKGCRRKCKLAVAGMILGIASLLLAVIAGFVLVGIFADLLTELPYGMYDFLDELIDIYKNLIGGGF